METGPRYSRGAGRGRRGEGGGLVLPSAATEPLDVGDRADRQVRARNPGTLRGWGSAERTRGSPESPTPGSPGALQHHLPGGPGGVSAGGPGGASAALRAPPRDPSAFPVPTGRGNPAAILCFFLAVLVLLLQLAEPLPVASAGESPRAAPRRVPAGLLSRDQVTSAWLPTTLRGRRRGGNHRSWGWRGCRAKPKRRLSVG